MCEDTPLRTGPPLELVQSGPRLLLKSFAVGFYTPTAKDFVVCEQE